jgi:DNA-directed RNA polymerase specialized sigma24 family protein
MEECGGRHLIVTLMTRVQAGDPEAYEDLLDDLLPRVRRLVLRQRSFLSAQDIDDLLARSER